MIEDVNGFPIPSPEWNPTKWQCQNPQMGPQWRWNPPLMAVRTRNPPEVLWPTKAFLAIVLLGIIKYTSWNWFLICVCRGFQTRHEAEHDYTFLVLSRLDEFWIDRIGTGSDRFVLPITRIIWWRYPSWDPIFKDRVDVWSVECALFAILYEALPLESSFHTTASEILENCRLYTFSKSGRPCHLDHPHISRWYLNGRYDPSVLTF